MIFFPSFYRGQLTDSPPVQMTDNNRVQQVQTHSSRLDNRSASIISTSSVEPEFSQLERKILLQKIFEQVNNIYHDIHDYQRSGGSGGGG